MRSNPERRAALTDAAIRVLAREGSRGLTFRAVDTEAEVPAGTTTNYFRSRDDLLAQVGARISRRLGPDPAEVAETSASPATSADVAHQLRALLHRVESDPSSYLAQLELRLEATRRPDLRAQLTQAARRDIEASVRHHTDTGAPGDARTVLQLYVAMTGILIERLTLPDILHDVDLGELIEDVTAAIAPDPT